MFTYIPDTQLFRDQGYGRMIMVSSTSGVVGNVGQANYGAAKMGIMALARIVAMENAAKGITANVVLPSADTRLTRAVPTPKDPQAAALRAERLRRSPADAIAPLCVYLAAEQSAHVNGQVFHQRGAELSLYSLPRPVRLVHRPRRLDPGNHRRAGHAGARAGLHAAGRRPRPAPRPAAGVGFAVR